MVYGGKMHGYVRMYWAKKILEWTKTPKEGVLFSGRELRLWLWFWLMCSLANCDPTKWQVRIGREVTASWLHANKINLPTLLLRDPNGIVGCLWAICGVHDRAWTGVNSPLTMLEGRALFKFFFSFQSDPFLAKSASWIMTAAKGSFLFQRTSQGWKLWFKRKKRSGRAKQESNSANE